MIARVSVDGGQWLAMTEATLAAILDLALAAHTRVTIDVDWIFR